MRIRVVMFVALLVLPASTAAARVVHVDATGTGCPGAEFTSIQQAIDGSGPGTTIQVCGGTYAEQLTITKKVKLVGTGSPVLRPAGMPITTTSLRTGRPIAAGIEVASPATIDGFEIDLSQNGLATCADSDPLLIGVFFRGSSGTLKNSRVHDVVHPPAASHCDSGAAVLVQGDGSRGVRVTVSGNNISAYQRAGIVANEARVKAIITNNVVMGAGVSSEMAQNGIQVGFGATASVVGNVVEDNAGPSGADCTFDGGNLSFQANSGTIKRNMFRGNTAGVIITGSKNHVISNTIDGRSGDTPVGLDGISVVGDRNVLTANAVSHVSEVGIRLSGSRNVAKKNTIMSTHEASFCAAARSLPGCSTMLAVCGVGLWITDGTGNVNAKNALSDNDVPMRDDAFRTVHAPY